MRIDAHQHFWKYDPVRDSWIEDAMAVLKRDFLPADLEPVLKANRMDGCIAVQADQSENETSFLLDLADRYSFIKGVVGWVALAAPDAGDRLAYFSTRSLLKGVRNIVQTEPDDYMLNSGFQNGISQLAQFDLTYDILIYPRQTNAAIQLVTKFPDQRFVLDHIAKPNIKDNEIQLWKEKIFTLAQSPNVYCKLSGMITEAGWNDWEPSDFTPYLDVIFDSFGIDRIMFGSDWPVCLLAGRYNQVLEIAEAYCGSFTIEEKDKIFGLNAVSFYGI